MIGAYKDAREYIFDEDGGLRDEQDEEKRERLVQSRARLRQSEYRKNLVDYWDGKCAVTSCGLTDVLIASHAKPWKKCETHKESVSQYNGFLLTPNIDRLFDYGFISFDEDGKIMISREVEEREYEALGLSKDMRLGKIEEGHRKYLVYHRENVFRG